jgi:hypothetical protein
MLAMVHRARRLGRTGTAVVVVALAGCAPLLGIDDVAYDQGSGALDAATDGSLDATTDGASGDGGGGTNDAAAPPDAAPDLDAATLVCPDGGSPILEDPAQDVDAWLSADTPSQVFSPLTSLIVKEPSYEALVRFTLSPPAAEAVQSGRLLRMVAKFSRALKDPSCVVDGGLCPTHQGVLGIHPILGAWAPAAVSWNTRASGVPWAVSGARGGSDEGAGVWSSNVSIVTNQVAAALDVTKLDITSITSHTITLKLEGTGGLEFRVASKQSTTYPPPSLSVAYCK